MAGGKGHLPKAKEETKVFLSLSFPPSSFPSGLFCPPFLFPFPPPPSSSLICVSMRRLLSSRLEEDDGDEASFSLSPPLSTLPLSGCACFAPLFQRRPSPSSPRKGTKKVPCSSTFFLPKSKIEPHTSSCELNLMKQIGFNRSALFCFSKWEVLGVEKRSFCQTLQFPSIWKFSSAFSCKRISFRRKKS